MENKLNNPNYNSVDYMSDFSFKTTSVKEQDKTGSEGKNKKVEEMTREITKDLSFFPKLDRAAAEKYLESNILKKLFLFRPSSTKGLAISYKIGGEFPGDKSKFGHCELMIRGNEVGVVLDRTNVRYFPNIRQMVEFEFSNFHEVENPDLIYITLDQVKDEIREET